MKSSQTSLPQSKSGAREAHDLRRAFIKELRRILRRTARDSSRRQVHAVRKDITKLRSWLRLARELIGPRQFQKLNRRLRRAARALAPVRDAHVMHATFEAISAGGAFPKANRHLRKQERRADKWMAARLRKANRLLENMLAASDRLPEKIAAADFAAALARLRGEMDAAHVAACADEAAESLHNWRKRTKNYLRALVFVEGARTPHHKPLARICRLLGEEHDLALLEEALTARGIEPERPALFALITARRAKLRAKIFRQ